MTIGIPLVGLGVLTWSALRGREPDPGVRALVATTVAYVAVTVLEVGAFASRFVEHLTERQLLSVAPPVFIAFAVWLYRGLPRPQPSTAVIALGVAASALLLPVGSITARAAAVDALSTIPLEHLRRHLSEAGFQTVYALVAALLVLLAVVVPKRFGAALAGIVAVALLAASIVASREIRDRSRAERESSFSGAPPSWMDENGAHDVGMLVTGELLWPGVWHQLFWNSSISGVVHLHGAALPGAAPQEEVSIARGRLAASSLGSARRVRRARCPVDDHRRGDAHLGPPALGRSAGSDAVAADWPRTRAPARHGATPER